MDLPLDNKISNLHLQKDAYVYIRQSSMRQVLQNTESQKRQYALRERALFLGWKEDQIQVIDDDLGESASHSGREGFSKLVNDVGMDKAGIVCSLEVSRFARNSSDWHHLLEICG
jgi:DNA invertase Pin-like site-specific DNA recombinase